MASETSSRRFIGKVIVEQEGKYWRLYHAIQYEDLDKGIGVRVPRGFFTDFASVPRLLWNLFPPSDPKYAAAAIVHDRLYETQELLRTAADDVFYDAMELLGTPRWKRAVMWTAVRLFGRGAYLEGQVRQRARKKLDDSCYGLRGRIVSISKNVKER